MTTINIWVVYDHPLDFPTGYVARRFENDTPTDSTVSSAELNPLRHWLMNQGLACVPRAEQDDPVIVEAWL